MSEPMPRDAEAEADLISLAFATAGRVLDEIALDAAEMFNPANETIWAAVQALHAVGKPADGTTVADYLRSTGDLNRVGGLSYLASFAGRYSISAGAPHYAAIVRERATRRTVIQVATRLQQVASMPTESPAEAIEAARHEIDSLADRVAGGQEVDLDEELSAAIDAIEHGTASMPTPWSDLNYLIGGWRKGHVYVIAARPGGGKSIVGGQAAVGAMLEHKVPVVMHSLEMTRTEVIQRAYSMIGEVDLANIMRGGPSVGHDEWDRISSARAELAETRFVIDDRSSPSVADIRGSITRCVRRHGSCGLVVIDYLQLVSGSGKAENRQTEVAGISRAIKNAAKDLRVPILVLAQLNRNPADGNRPPRPSDLRESGALEQDADVVLLLHREDNAPHEVVVGVGKNRHGPKSSFKLQWQGHYSRLMDEKWRPHHMRAAAEQSATTDDFSADAIARRRNTGSAA
jgi:replicative DNA helicase